MHPILVRVLPPSVRRGYYELVDYQLPLLLNHHRWWHKIKWLLSPSYRAEHKRRALTMKQLMEALSAGYSNPSTVGEPLRIESLEPVMKIVTFDDKHIKFRRRRRRT